MRLALLASPRSGNNWFRRVLADSLGYAAYASHTLAEFPTDVPEDAILNIHEIHSPESEAFFRRLDCRCIALARHPLDVLVSVLQFARKVPGVHQWLGGTCNIPKNACDLVPDDDAYVDWMCSDGARNLLSVTLSWWTAPATAVRVKYEDLIGNAEAEVARVIDSLGLQPAASVSEALQTYSMAWFFKNTRNGWLGTKDNYTRFLTPENALKVLKRHQINFDTLGYEVQYPNALSGEEARHNYLAALTVPAEPGP